MFCRCAISIPLRMPLYALFCFLVWKQFWFIVNSWLISFVCKATHNFTSSVCLKMLCWHQCIGCVALHLVKMLLYTVRYLQVLHLQDLPAIDNIFCCILNVLISTFFVLDCFFVFFSFFFFFYCFFRLFTSGTCSFVYYNQVKRIRDFWCSFCSSLFHTTNNETPCRSGKCFSCSSK